MDIDFVIINIDDSDPRWQAEYQEYKPVVNGIKNAPCRFREWGWMKYWFRSVEKYAPWVRKIWYVVAYESQVPEWLDRNNPKLEIVYHEDYIPKEYLPTFNSHTIELNLHRIKGLAEHFVYFNDDMFINAPVAPEYYFKNGLPCDVALQHPMTAPCYNKKNEWSITHIELCNVGMINLHFNRKKVMMANKKGWFGTYLGINGMVQALFSCFNPVFCNFGTPHYEKPLLKSSFEEVWAAEPEYLSKSCTRFREDLNVSIYLMRLWHLASNRFVPTKLKNKEYIRVTKDNLGELRRAMMSQRVTSVCIEDTWRLPDEDFPKVRDAVNDIFASKLPRKSSFEK